MTTLVQLLRTFRRLGVAAAAGVLPAGAALVVAAPGASAIGVTAVDCSTTNLQTAIDNAGPGATLAVTGTCFGNFTIDKNLILLGQRTAVLDGQHHGTTLAVSSGATVRLATLAITDGNARGTGGNGGGINNFGTLRLDQSTVKNNGADNWGGGIYNDSSAALTLNDTTVSGNSGTVFGGGVYNSGGAMTLVGSSVSGNTATYGGGGIFSVNSFVDVTLRDSRITGNTATAGSGGGIFNLSNTETLKDSMVSGNTAALYGGGINNNASTTTLGNSTVTHNTAHVDGGGIYNFSATSTLTDSNVSGNTPDNCVPPDPVAGCTG